jgi:uncharacterized membrane protein
MIEDLQLVLDVLVGPYGVVAAEGIVIFFLYRLYKEAIKEGKQSQANVALLTAAVKELTSGVRATQDGFDKFFERWDTAQLGFREFLGEIRHYMGTGNGKAQ